MQDHNPGVNRHKENVSSVLYVDTIDKGLHKVTCNRYFVGILLEFDKTTGHVIE